MHSVRRRAFPLRKIGSATHFSYCSMSNLKCLSEKMLNITQLLEWQTTISLALHRSWRQENQCRANSTWPWTRGWWPVSRTPIFCTSLSRFFYFDKHTHAQDWGIHNASRWSAWVHINRIDISLFGVGSWVLMSGIGLIRLPTCGFACQSCILERVREERVHALEFKMLIPLLSWLCLKQFTP